MCGIIIYIIQSSGGSSWTSWGDANSPHAYVSKFRNERIGALRGTRRLRPLEFSSDLCFLFTACIDQFTRIPKRTFGAKDIKIKYYPEPLTKEICERECLVHPITECKAYYFNASAESTLCYFSRTLTEPLDNAVSTSTFNIREQCTEGKCQNRLIRPARLRQWTVTIINTIYCILEDIFFIFMLIAVLR